MMSYKKNLKFIFQIICFFLCHIVVAQKFQYLEYNTSSGLPDDYIYGMEQDSMGTIWIASGSGLIKLNDRSSKLVKYSDSRSELIYDLELANNRIWLSGKNGLIGFSDGQIIDTLSTPFKSKVIKVNKFQDSKIIFSSAKEGYYIYDYKTKKGVLYSYDDINTSKIRNVVLDGDNLFFCSNSGITYLKFNKEEDVFELVQNFEEYKYINSILKYDNQLYLATEKHGVRNAEIVDGLIKSTNRGVKIETKFGTTIKDISLDVEGKIWVSTFGEGAFQLLVEGNEILDVKRFNVKNGLVSDFVNKVFQDYEGNYWFETYGGGLAYRPNDYLKDLNISFQGDETVTSIEHLKNKLYLSNKNAIHNYYQDSLYFVCELENKDMQITCMSILDSMHLYIGTRGNGVFLYDFTTKRMTQIPYVHESLAMKVNDLELDGNHLWIATYDGLYDYNIQSKRTTVYNSSNGLRHNLVRVIKNVKNRGLAVGTKNNRLFFVKDKKVSEIKLPSPNPNMNISDIVEINEDLLIGTLGSGLFLLQKDSIKHFTQDDGLASNYIYGLKEVSGTKVLVVHQDNLTSIDISNNSINKVLEKIGFHHLFQINAITKTDNNEVQIGTDYGVIQFSPREYYQNSIQPKLGFNQFMINDSIYDLSIDKINLKYDNYKLVLDYKGVSFNNSSEIHYEYFLEGFDEYWHNGDGYDFAGYKNIGPGSYRFLIRACVKGECTEKTSVCLITVDSPIWQKPWFIILVSVILVLFVFGSFWLQERENNRRKKVLEYNIKLKTKELNLKNDQIVSSISYAKRIQDAVIPKIRFSPKGDGELSDISCFTLEKPKDIVGGDFVWFVETEDVNILAVCDCTGHGVPGGFMTILTIDMLNSIIGRGCYEPNEILSELDQLIIQKLHADAKRTINDGLDMGLVSINKHTGQIKYSGANRPVVVDDKKEGLKLFKGTRRSIGDQYSKKVFENIEFNYTDLNMIYIYSDGVIDQFGGPINKKFTTKRLINLLSEIKDESLKKQKEALDTTLSEWAKTSDSQTDDISFMGIKLN